MGYESKLYIVEKHEMIREDGKCYASVHAVFNMNKVYALSDVLRDQPATDCYIFADDGDTKITKDMYDRPLTEVSVTDAIHLVERIIETDHWWKYGALLAALKEVEKQQASTIVVLHYGY